MRVTVTGATGLIGSTGIPLRRSGGDAARRAQPAIDAGAAAQGPRKRSGQPADPADIARATRYCAAAAPRCGCSRHRGRRRGRRTGTGIAAARAPGPVSAKTLDTPRRKAIMSDLPGSTTLAVGAGQGLGCGPGVRVPQAERAGKTTAMRAIVSVASLEGGSARWNGEPSARGSAAGSACIRACGCSRPLREAVDGRGRCGSAGSQCRDRLSGLRAKGASLRAHRS